MEEFVFHQHEKISVWQRHTFEVKASSQAEAEEFIRERRLADSTEWHDYTDELDGRVEVYDTETLFETQELIPVDENGGCTTIEIDTVDHTPVADNCGNRLYLANSGQWRERAIEQIQKRFEAPEDKVTEFVDKCWGNDTSDEDNLFRFDMWLHGGDPFRKATKRELWAFLFPIDRMERDATDGEIVAAYQRMANNRDVWAVEKLTPAEFACRVNEDAFASLMQWVRFIEL